MALACAALEANFLRQRDLVWGIGIGFSPTRRDVSEFVPSVLHQLADLEDSGECIRGAGSWKEFGGCMDIAE
jgi:hypothetical protein